jgi:hypothetical protein
MKLRSENDEPISTCLRTEKLLEKRAAERRLRELPRKKQFAAESWPENWNVPATESPEPQRAKALILKADPIWR